MDKQLERREKERLCHTTRYSPTLVVPVVTEVVIEEAPPPQRSQSDRRVANQPLPKPNDDQIQAAREKEKQEKELRDLYRTPPAGEPKHPPPNRSAPYRGSKSFEERAAEMKNAYKGVSQAKSTPVTQPRSVVMDQIKPSDLSPSKEPRDPKPQR